MRPTTINTLTKEEQEACNDEEDLFDTISNRFKQQYNEMIKLLQFCKLVRQQDKTTEEWMDRLRILATECNYHDIDRYLKEQFIHNLNDNSMMVEIISELTKGENKDVTSNQVLLLER